MKKLSFAVKANMNRPPRVHVQSADKKTTYGAFQANDCSEFNGWEKLSKEETIELKRNCSYPYDAACQTGMKNFYHNLLTRFLALNFVISQLCSKNGVKSSF